MHLTDIHVHRLEREARTAAIRYWHGLLHRAHSKAVNLSREYCHIAYFAGVFLEGHGAYTYAAGALLVLSLIGVVAGEPAEEVMGETSE